jgi:hypothetical protein
MSILFANHRYGENLDFFAPGDKIDNELGRLLYTLGKKKFKFSDVLLNRVLAQYSEDIKWIEERMGIPFQEESKVLESDISSEEDMLVFSDETIHELKALIHKDNLPKESSPRYRYVSLLVDILRVQIAEKFGIKRLSSKQVENEYNIIKNFSIDWSNYFKINHIENISQNPIFHYIHNWKHQNLLINDEFDSFFYLNRYPDIKTANINPLIHYYKHGIKEGREGKRNL